MISMQEGDVAPDFELQANDGSVTKLGYFKGKKNTVLCFYPKNHLFACPSKKVFKMAQTIVAAFPEIAALDAYFKTNSPLSPGSLDRIRKAY